MPKFIVTEVIEIKVTAIIEADNAVKAHRSFKNTKENGSVDFSEESHIIVREEKKISFGG